MKNDYCINIKRLFCKKEKKRPGSTERFYDCRK
jgi:hypothetical protein